MSKKQALTEDEFNLPPPKPVSRADIRRNERFGQMRLPLACESSFMNDIERERAKREGSK